MTTLESSVAGSADTPEMRVLQAAGTTAATAHPQHSNVASSRIGRRSRGMVGARGNTDVPLAGVNRLDTSTAGDRYVTIKVGVGVAT